MSASTVLTLTRSQTHWPRSLDERLAEAAPSRLSAIGNLDILMTRGVALFCSVRCPGDAILRAYDTARKLRDEGVTVVSGFQSPVEKECLRILLRSGQPIIIGLARSMEKIRLPKDWRGPLEGGRLLLLSPFAGRPRRPDKSDVRRRNELVLALADELWVVHAEPGGEVERLVQLSGGWNIPKRQIVDGG